MNPALPLVPNYNFSAGENDEVYQPSWTLSEDTRGLLEGTLTWRRQVSPSSPRTPNLPQRGEPHAWDPRLRCHQSQLSFGEQGQCMVQASYIGLVQDPTLAEVEISAAASSQTLQLHPNFTSMAMSQAPTASNSNFAFHPYVDTVNQNRKDFERFNAITAPEGLRGADSYYAPKGTARVTFYTANQGTVTKYLSNVGTIEDTIPNINGPVPSGHNYLLVNASVATYGIIYKISAEWMFSDQGIKWSDKIYRKFGSGGKLAEAPKYSIGGNYNIGAKWSF